MVTKFFKIIGLVGLFILGGCSGMDQRGPMTVLGSLAGAGIAAASGAHRGGIVAGAGVGGAIGYMAGQGVKTERYYDEYQPSVQAKGYAVTISCQQAEVNAYNMARLRVQNEGGNIQDYFTPFNCGQQQQYQQAPPPRRPAYRARIQYDEDEYYGR
ncbi:MAG: hypothetical protein A2675_04220 [Candidatus Yonathbacteria bacterium RIFCSPHIGHO2_01_FULL_51_10]|uniref:Glycine zipper domain-containing protein n=1 Tax=Candidatus Yonathbacteria bacterium RIFCSPHIGHO2_01_FULL_51_10 TaxID=1802723 RepID=A0A1G2S5D9_9BACT|nr:MAG: hypothetical protein A2675_04220 [Candidatus Yonathbacteria bacterium RIFCSPHIGHO2_01_FULL_51_10]